MNASLKDRLPQTDRHYATISKILAAAAHDGTPRSRLAGSLCAIALEHGYSIRALLEVNHVTSAIPLLRTQFEAVVRAMWMNFAAPEGWVAKCAGLIESNCLKELAAPTMDDMLAAIDAAAPESIGRMQLVSMRQHGFVPTGTGRHTIPARSTQ